MKKDARAVRYAVVGLGHFAQSAILPAFAHAPNAELVALVSGDPKKLEKLKKATGARFAVSYDDYDDFLATGAVDAVYIALPNHLHADYTIRAAKAGVHVLCEKPLAVSVDECRAMIAACAKARVQLMTAYRLHFEPSNVRSAKLIASGRIGEPRLLSTTFSMELQKGNVRAKPVPGAGPLYDIGTYCINAARSLFRSEPEEVFAFSESSGRGRARRDDQFAAVLKFPQGKLATLAVSFDAEHDSRFSITGTKGVLESRPAFSHSGALEQTLTVGDRVEKRKYVRHDQVAAELIEFSKCVLGNVKPEPSGEEGLLDVRVIEALKTSARLRKPVRLPRMGKARRPSANRAHAVKAATRKAKLVKVAAPGKH